MTLTSRDPFIVSEVLFRCYKAKLRIVEVPIVFVDRTRGISKLGLTTLLKYLTRVLMLRFS